jgi:hypothetical protein
MPIFLPLYAAIFVQSLSYPETVSYSTYFHFEQTFTLSAPSSLKIGRFASFAQAIFLLGRVYKHVSDYTTSKDFLFEEASQLRRTLQALAKIVCIEGQSEKLQFYTQAALCYR